MRSVEILDSPGICHPESLRFWQGEGSAFRLSVAISPESQGRHPMRMVILRKSAAADEWKDFSSH